MANKILVVGGNRIMRAGIKALLEGTAEFRVVAEAETGQQAALICKRARPDLVIMHIGMAGLNRVDTARELLQKDPSAALIILSTCDDDDFVVNAIRSGARGLLFRHASSADLIDALRTVVHGGSYLDPNVSDRLLSGVHFGELDAQRSSRLLEKLTARERQVLSLILEGKTSKEIAGALNLGAETVSTHRRTMMKKLGVNNVAGLFKAHSR